VLEAPVLEAPVLEAPLVEAPQAVPANYFDQGLSQGGAAYAVSTAASTQAAKTVESSGTLPPPLFDTSLLLSGQLAALAAEAAAAVKGIPAGLPDPFLPSGFPSGTPPVGSTSRGASGLELGLDLLAVLALLLVLSRIGGSSVSPREGFRLASSPGLVAELPG
jgi:hypothetical protein